MTAQTLTVTPPVPMKPRRRATSAGFELVIMTDGPGPLDNAVGRALILIEKDIRGSDLKSLEHRHHSGEYLLKQRGNAKRLPMGFRAALIDELGISATEINNRMRLAEKYQVKDLSNLLDKFSTWYDICRKALFDKAVTIGKPTKKAATPAIRSKAQTLSRTLADYGDMITPADRRALAMLARTITKILEAQS